jgi:hypothetical protein
MKILHSLKSVINEKINSPLAGTFIISWSVWNWKPLYATFFIQQSKLEITKLDYVIPLFNDYWNLIFRPIVSTIVIILILPIISSLVKLWITFVKKIYLENDLKLRKITPVPRDELVSFYDELDKAEKLHNVEKNSLISKIKTLGAKIESQKANTAILKEPTKEVKKTIELNPVFTKLDHNLFESIYNKSDTYDKRNWHNKLFHKDPDYIIERISTYPIFNYYEEHKFLEILSKGYYKLSKKGIKFNEFLEQYNFVKAHTKPPN